MMKRLGIAVVVVAILLGLAFWQLHRAEWKQGLVTTIALHQEMPPLQTIVGGNVDDMAYRRAILSGTTNRSAGFELLPRTFNGKNGRHWIVPMVVPTGTETGTVVLVNLGWIPDDYIIPANAGMNVETISGTLVPPPKANAFTLPSNPATGKIYSIDIQAIADYMKTPVFPLILYADALGEVPPIGGQAVLTLPQNHKLYAAFWFAMAIVAAVIFGVAHHKAGKSNEPKAE